MPDELTPFQRQMLKGRAHALDPVVLIGAEGLTSAVLAEVDRALRSHELIKIRVMGADRHERERLLESICAQTEAVPVQHIGKIIVVYREKPPEETPPASRAETGTPPRRSASPRSRSGKKPPAKAARRFAPSFRPRRGKARPR
jgi:RNA-binding protein